MNYGLNNLARAIALQAFTDAMYPANMRTALYPTDADRRNAAVRHLAFRGIQGPGLAGYITILMQVRKEMAA